MEYALFDCCVMPLNDQDVYEFFQTQDDFPSEQDLKDFRKGPAMILGMRNDVRPDGVLRMVLRDQYSTIAFSVNTLNIISFWFGKS